MKARIRAAVVGIGKVGSRFDEEPERKTVWSHVGAYLALPQAYTLTGVCETDSENATAFYSRCPNISIYNSIEELIAKSDPHVISICTPTATHPEILNAVSTAPHLKVVWCEKPLALNLGEAKEMVETCKMKGVKLVVSYTRRWQPLWQRLKKQMDEGIIGKIRCIRVAMPNRFFSIGSHAVDLVQMLGGRVTDVKTMEIPPLYEEGEPALSALMELESMAYAILQVTGKKNRFMVEAEVIGDGGRLMAREDFCTIAFEQFVPSQSFSNYVQLNEPIIEKVNQSDYFSPFVAIAEEISELASVSSLQPSCDGVAALEVQRVLADMESNWQRTTASQIVKTEGCFE